MLLQTGPFLEELQKQFMRLESDEVMGRLRGNAWTRLLERGLPQKKEEAFQYVHLRELYEKSYALPEKMAAPSTEELSSLILPECTNSCLVFVEGVYSPELSKVPPGLIVLPLPKALRSYQTLLQGRLEGAIAGESDPFALLNLAFAAGEAGVFIYLPPKKSLEAPLQCLHLSRQQGVIASPRIHAFIGREAELQIISSFQPAEGAWINSMLDLTLEEGARVKQASTLLNESRSWIFDAIRATQKRDSSLETVSISRGAKSHRQSFNIALTGENAEASLNGTWLLNNDFSCHAHVLVDHSAPHTRSRQLFKGVLDGISQSSFEGKIFVHPEAQKTEAYQLNNNLILGERALAFSKPNLQIFADDVKASHGATIGQLDANLLFYLKTRGIPDSIASRLLVRAFCQEVGAKLPLPSMRAQLAQELARYL
ncbi:MAG: Fe-S cluster assembly protein SufD [Chlamydiales bacterium]|nr:Fe-S cluster assembly protein SufD [Chlamydiales bacterium]